MSFPSIDYSLKNLKNRLLSWAATYPYAVVLDNCQSEIDRYGKYEFLVGVAAETAPRIEQWADFPAKVTTWLMGLIPYELKNVLEPHLHTQLSTLMDWPEVALFQPEVVLAIPRGQQEIRCLHGNMPTDWPVGHRTLEGDRVSGFQPTVSQADYLATINRLQQHIKEGDCYEINLAQAFVSTGTLQDPCSYFARLTEISPVPFAALFRWNHQYILSASPERFLQLQGDRLLTQPIKGTTKRGQDSMEDELLKAELARSPKEQAENVMIVDLSRNDLHRSCNTGSVEVPHLFEIQAFPQVFQLVSTVQGIKRKAVGVKEVIGHTFPPGSMTGAPKVRTLELIDQYESVARGAYAGSMGYFDPTGNFDLNVIIRSLMYDSLAARLHYQVGGAITYDSDPRSEYEETLVKAKAIRALFS